MANPEHLDILRQGVEVWNAWRKKHPDEQPDFVTADLSGASLSGANLSGVNLSDALLSYANLSRANHSVVRLNNAILSGADLSHANLSRAEIGYPTGCATRYTHQMKWFLPLRDFSGGLPFKCSWAME